MELKNGEKLQMLRAKALDLDQRINSKIYEHGFTFCSHCSNHGRYCVVADSSRDERERMIAISESLQELHNLIISLEELKSNQKRQRDEALARIEESRKVVRERVTCCSKEGRESVGVLYEVIEFVGDGKRDDFLWDLKWEINDHVKKKKKNVNRVYSFVVGTTRFGLEFLVIFATIYTTLKFAKNGKEEKSDDSTIQEPRILLTNDHLHLDVLRGRG